MKSKVKSMSSMKASTRLGGIGGASKGKFEVNAIIVRCGLWELVDRMKGIYSMDSFAILCLKSTWWAGISGWWICESLSLFLSPFWNFYASKLKCWLILTINSHSSAASRCWSFSTTATASSRESALSLRKSLARLGICESSFELVVGRLFHQFCILQSINEFELFSFHSSDIRLVLGLLIGLAGQLLLDLLPRAILSLHELHFTLLGSLLLLLLNHGLHVSSALLLRGPLLLVHLPSRLLLHLGVEGDLFLPHLRILLAVLDDFVGLLFVMTIHLPFHSLFHLLLTQSILFGLLRHDISLALADDLISSLPRLIDLLDHLYRVETDTSEVLLISKSLYFVNMIWCEKDSQTDRLS